MSSIPASEVAKVFRQALRGEIAVKLTSARSWREVHCGDVEFAFGEWRITLFNDAMELDYVESVVAPDGRAAEYKDWFDSATHDGADPVELLSESERIDLESMVEAAA